MRGRAIIDVLNYDDPRWLDCVEGGDFYQRPDYARLESRRLGGVARGYRVQAGAATILLPLVVCPCPFSGGRAGGSVGGSSKPERLDGPADLGPSYDAFSPYGYGGPWIEAGNESACREALRVLVERLREDRVVSAFVRPHPLQAWPPGLLGEFGQLCHHGPTVFVDLAQREEQQWASYRSSYRNLIRRQRREGFEVEFDERWTALPEFAALFRSTMQRVGAGERNGFDEEYLDGLARVLEGRSVLALARRDGRLGAAAIFSLQSTLAQYHLSASDPDLGQEVPTRLLIHEFSRWARARGATGLHLGGGVGGREDALYRFKAGFSPKRAQLHTWRVIPWPERYREFSDAWERAHKRKVDPPSGFFPAYRKL